MSITPRKQRAISSLLEFGSVSRAADECGVSRQSLYRWLHQDEFAAALRTASGEMVEQASRRLTHLMFKAVDLLERIVDDSASSTRERSRAAELIIVHGAKLHEMADIEERISALERRVKHDRAR